MLVGGRGAEQCRYTHEAVISYVSALLFFAGSRRSLAHARPVSVDVIRENSERGSAVSRRQSSFSKHLFISPKSFPSTRPVKTTPTEAHNWSRKRQRANQRSVASGNARHIHTALQLVEFRSTGNACVREDMGYVIN
ncbi:uncharacterized [Tachysurus ichikawai]